MSEPGNVRHLIQQFNSIAANSTAEVKPKSNIGRNSTQGSNLADAVKTADVAKEKMPEIAKIAPRDNPKWAKFYPVPPSPYNEAGRVWTKVYPQKDKPALQMQSSRVTVKLEEALPSANASSAIKADPHLEIREKLQEYSKAIDFIAKHPNYKLKAKETEQGVVISTTKRGIFGLATMKSQGTQELLNNLKGLGKSVSETGDFKLTDQFLKTVDNLENTKWGKDFTKNETIKNEFKDLKESITDKFVQEKDLLIGGNYIKAEQALTNPNATRAEILEARSIFEDSKIPGKDNDALDNKIEKLEKKLLTIDKEKIPSLILGDSGFDRDLLLQTVAWTPTNNKIQPNDFAAPLEKAINSHLSNPSEKTLSSLLDASIKLADLPNLDKANSGIKEQLDRVQGLAKLSSKDNQALGKVLEQKLANLDRTISLKPIITTSSPNGTDLSTAIDQTVGRPVDRKDLLKALTEDLRNQQSALFANIDPSEFENLKWTKADATLAPNIKEAIAFFNNGSNKIVASILDTDEPHVAKERIKFYIGLADSCFKDNDFQSALLINTALSNASISRIIKQYEDNGQLTEAGPTLKHLEEELDSRLNYKAYRANFEKTLENGDKPIPLLGSILSDLTFATENGIYTKEGNNLNLHRAYLIDKALSGFLTSKKSLNPSTERKTNFNSDSFSPKVKPATDTTHPQKEEDIIYAKSLALFPRQKAS